MFLKQNAPSDLLLYLCQMQMGSTTPGFSAFLFHQSRIWPMGLVTNGTEVSLRKCDVVPFLKPKLNWPFVSIQHWQTVWFAKWRCHKLAVVPQISTSLRLLFSGTTVCLMINTHNRKNISMCQKGGFYRTLLHNSCFVSYLQRFVRLKLLVVVFEHIWHQIAQTLNGGCERHNTANGSEEVQFERDVIRPYARIQQRVPQPAVGGAECCVCVGGGSMAWTFHFALPATKITNPHTRCPQPNMYSSVITFISKCLFLCSKREVTRLLKTKREERKPSLPSNRSHRKQILQSGKISWTNS